MKWKPRHPARTIRNGPSSCPTGLHRYADAAAIFWSVPVGWQPAPEGVHCEICDGFHLKYQVDKLRQRDTS